MLIESGSADITLGRGSVLTGALIERGGVNRLALDASSVWNVRADSSLAVLDNAGTVAFVAPGAKGGFKTLTVNQYIDGGLLVLNTRLGDDASPTDRLVIDGGSATAAPRCASSTPAEAERRRRKASGWCRRSMAARRCRTPSGSMRARQAFARAPARWP